MAIVSPSSTVCADYVAGAAAALRDAGFEPVVMPHALGPADGSFAASRGDRLEDFMSALRDPSVRAILCARGGYGAVHLLDRIPPEEVRANAKWLIGFSDISALHALWHAAGVQSVHGPMAKYMAQNEGDNAAIRRYLELLGEDTFFAGSAGKGAVLLEAGPDPRNIPGRARGRLVGGNLAVLNGLAGTSWDLLSAPLHEDCILFIEDVSEPVYAVERMLTRLALNGTLKHLKGLVVGQWTEYKPDRNWESVEDMIAALLRRYGITGIPVMFGAPIGHVEGNVPVIEGAEVELTVDGSGGCIKLAASSMSDAPDNGDTAGGDAAPLTLAAMQETVDRWIKGIGHGYHSELTNMVLLMEEAGELARVMARVYGDQVPKRGDLERSLADEMADVLWVLTCLANQTGVDLTQAFAATLRKKTDRDRLRFKKEKGKMENKRWE